MTGLETTIRQRPAFIMHEAAAAALAEIDSPELRRSAATLVATAYYQVRASGTQRRLRRSRPAGTQARHQVSHQWHAHDAVG